MGNFWKDLAGPHYETLEKAIYRKETGRVLDALPEVYTPLLAVPRGLMSWVIQNVKPIEVNETKKLEVPGSDAVLEIRKILSDTYSGTIVSKGKVIHQFEMIPLPAVAGTLLSVLELYDDVAGRKVEEVEKKEIAETLKDDKVSDLIEKLGGLIDKIVQLNSAEKKITEAPVVQAPAAPAVTVHVHVNGQSASPEKTEAELFPKADLPKAEASKPEEIKPNQVEKAEMLSKPYVSDAQRKWAHTPTGKKALGGEKAVEHWDAATKGKKLPEKAGKQELTKDALTEYKQETQERSQIKPPKGEARKIAEQKEIARRAEGNEPEPVSPTERIAKLADSLKARREKRAELNAPDPIQEMSQSRPVELTSGLKGGQPVPNSGVVTSVDNPEVGLIPHTEQSGASVQGELVRRGHADKAKARAKALLIRLQAQRAPMLPKAELDKAKEDTRVPEQNRAEYRRFRQEGAKDPLQSEVTTEPGVSDTGIEVRRADPKVKGAIAHGYARVSDADKHRQIAANRIKEHLAYSRLRGKPNLPKAELDKAAPKMETGGAQAKPMMPQAPKPTIAPVKGPKLPKLGGAQSKPTMGGSQGVKVPQTKMPAMPKAPTNPVAMKSVMSVTKDELESATSDSGEKMFNKKPSAYDEYVFSPSGCQAVMTKDSMKIAKNEDGTYGIMVDSSWDGDNVELVKMMIKARTLLKNRFGF